jgi:arylsulfatase A-like enzyme/cytochrome c-type biogenesis protein CcmH/NrfG
MLLRPKRWLVLVVLFIGVCFFLYSARQDPPINILLITLDTTRADHLGCYGYQNALTPAMDSVAREGVLFERAYATAPLTLPSHASLFTGLYPPEHGVRTNGRGKFVAPDPLLSDVLSEADYKTGAFIASFVLDARFGLKRGFQVYDDDIKDTSHHDDLLHRERNGAAVVNSALAWLERPRSQPFYCWVHLYDPHFPYQTHSEAFGERFQDRPYDAEIAYVDRQIGKLLSFLKKSGLDSNTLVVIVGDHGEGMGEHVEQTHGYTLYNSTQHVPLIIKCPGRSVPGHRHPDPVSLVDVFPTICDLMEQQSPQGISGRSLVAAMKGNPVAPVNCYSATDDPFLQQGWSPQRSLTTKHWKYIRTTKPELYDLRSDPNERQNLAANAPDKLKELERVLSELEEGMSAQESENVQLSERERRTLQSLGYLGHAEPGQTAINQDGPLVDVKDMLQHDADARVAFDMMHSGQVDEAVDRLKEIVSHASGHASSRVFLGEALEMKGDLPGAIDSFEQALQIKPDHIDALIRLGAAWGESGDLKKAIGYFDEAVQINPESVQARLGLGRALFYQGQFGEAAGNLEFAMKMDPELPGVRLVLSEALRQSGRRKEAIPYLHEELRRDPGSVPARMNLAAVLVADDWQQALQILQETQELSPDNPHIPFQIGEILLSQNRPSEAIQFFNQTVRIMPEHPEVQAALERAQALLNK